MAIRKKGKTNKQKKKSAAPKGGKRAAPRKQGRGKKGRKQPPRGPTPADPTPNSAHGQRSGTESPPEGRFDDMPEELEDPSDDLRTEHLVDGEDEDE